MADNKNSNNAVGASLFTGEHSIFVQNNEHQDDEEDMEDQLRRQEELQNLIANAFDDLEFENENSRVNSSFESTNSSKYRSNISLKQGAGDNYSFTDKNYKNTSLNSFEQLQVLYQVRVQESQKLTNELDALKEQLITEREQTNKKLLLLEADNNRINISLQQSQALLVDKNEIIEKKSKEIEQLKEFSENLQSSNKKFEEEILFWKSNTNELEQKLHLMERGINKNASEKHIRGHYEQEIHKLQEILNVTNFKLEKKENECHSLLNRIQDIEHDKDVALAEKSGVINSVTKSLEDSQAQCFSLMNKLTSLQQEHTSLQQEHSSLKNERHTNQDLTNLKYSSTQNYEDIIVTLREELRRCLEEQNKKRQEINHLEDLLKEFRQKENNLLQELNNKQTKENIENKELKQKNSKMTEEIIHLEQKIIELEELLTRQSKNSNLNSSKSSINSETRQQKREEYEELKQELNRVEKQISDSLNLKDRYINCEQQCLTLQEKIKELNSKLSESQIIITTLKEKLVLKEERDNLIENLKKKAEMFEEYMANKSEPNPLQNTSMNTSNYLPETNDGTTQTEDNTDKQLTTYVKQLTTLEKIIENQTTQLHVLYEENKSLKEKIIFDRNSFTELTTIWSQETKKLNKTLNITLGKNEELRKNIDVLEKESAQKQIMCDILNSKIEQAKEYINLIEVTSTRHNKHVLFEHEQVKAKFEDILEIVQARLTRCIDVTKSNMML